MLVKIFIIELLDSEVSFLKLAVQSENTEIVTREPFEGRTPYQWKIMILMIL